MFAIMVEWTAVFRSCSFDKQHYLPRIFKTNKTENLTASLNSKFIGSFEKLRVILD